MEKHGLKNVAFVLININYYIFLIVFFTLLSNCYRILANNESTIERFSLNNHALRYFQMTDDSPIDEDTELAIALSRVSGGADTETDDLHQAIARSLDANNNVRAGRGGGNGGYMNSGGLSPPSEDTELAIALCLADSEASETGEELQ